MGNREVPFNKDEKCDVCGKLGAFDFMGDLICGDCLKPKQQAIQVQAKVKPACDVADIKIKAKLMENKYWLNYLTLDTTNIINKSCIEDRIVELVKIQNENRKSL